jgi:hypothetical protein
MDVGGTFPIQPSFFSPFLTVATPAAFPLPEISVSGEPGTVTPDQMLRELSRAAQRMGVEVRFEPFGPRALRPGGLCTLYGHSLVLVDENAPVVDQVAVLCEALAAFDIEVIYVPPLLRARIQRGRGRAR